MFEILKGLVVGMMVLYGIYVLIGMVMEFTDHQDWLKFKESHTNLFN